MSFADEYVRDSRNVLAESLFVDDRAALSPFTVPVDIQTGETRPRIRLLSDVDHAVGEAYGTARPPDHDWAAVARRRTYLIDPDGVVRKVYDVKDFGGHPEEVLADLRALQSQ